MKDMDKDKYYNKSRKWNHFSVQQPLKPGQDNTYHITIYGLIYSWIWPAGNITPLESSTGLIPFLTISKFHTSAVSLDV